MHAGCVCTSVAVGVCVCVLVSAGVWLPQSLICKANSFKELALILFFVLALIEVV